MPNPIQTPRINPIHTPQINRILPPHELNARRARKRVLPRVPVPQPNLATPPSQLPKPIRKPARSVPPS